ncbi:MAG: type II toxin-antitoxin system VapC family toxin [Terracidiphilus sp.]
MTIYSDSSFIASYYLEDAHSAEVDRRMAQRPRVWLTSFNRTEVEHAISHMVFRRRISLAEAQLARNDFAQDCAQGIWIAVGLPESIWEASIKLARQFAPTLGVRTLDSLHVACALELKAERFWTFDERQGRLAETVGLDTCP